MKSKEDNPVGTRRTTHRARARRRADAASRQYARTARSDQEQLERLENRGAGQCKEAVRLREAIAGTKKPRRKGRK